MSSAELTVLFAVFASEPCSFATISYTTRYATAALIRLLDDLQHRGFIRRTSNGMYLLADDVGECLPRLH